jgi:chemotaxis family two-component system response regulator Rcp1
MTTSDSSTTTSDSSRGVEPIEILLVEDSPADVDLTREALDDAKLHNNLHVVTDGVEALEFLRREGSYADAPRPDLVLLDLNLPKKDGREVLAEIKADPILRRIPVVILTTSQAEQDILKSYDLHANCYVTKPVDLDQFVTVVRSIENFWLVIAKLPKELP